MPIQITKNNWLRYVKALAKIDETAGDLVTEYLAEHSILSEEGMRDLLDFVYGVVTKYGEGSAELACLMYDATAKAQGASVPPAEPAPTATYPETARAVRGSMMDSPSGAKVPDAAKRLVKQAGVDTTVQNAIRDGAEFAWVPQGDTCSFCLMLASNGWQHASKKALKKGHAEHIHANCDCTYAVRFDGKSGVKGYDPDEYKAMYDNAEGDNWREKLNSMRREHYAENKERINEQKRAAYAKREKELQMVDARSILNIETGGQRNETPLTEDQIEACRSYAESLGMTREQMAYSENYWTSYNPEFDLLLIGTDAYPGENATSANGKLSYRSAIAHEIVGHREACLRGKTDYQKGDFRDEAQASIRAARFAPGLTDAERYMLIRDALDRIHKNGYKLRDVKSLLDIWER